MSERTDATFKDPRHERGNQAESISAEYLNGHGLRILERNYSRKCGEIDIIARLKDTLVFVEVRSAGGDYLETPALTVNKTKQRKVIRTAQWYIAEEENEHLSVRFDVVAVQFNEGSTRVTWLPDAFRPGPTATCGRLV